MTVDYGSGYFEYKTCLCGVEDRLGKEKKEKAEKKAQDARIRRSDQRTRRMSLALWRTAWRMRKLKGMTQKLAAIQTNCIRSNHANASENV